MTRDTYDSNHDINDVTSAVPARRMQVLSGPERRRRWPHELKVAIVTEALAKGVIVSDVARRHDMAPSQLFAWVKLHRAEAEALASSAPAFTPAVLTTDAAAPMRPESVGKPASIEISVGSATLRVRGDIDAGSLAVILKAMKVFA
jgi:transposase